MRSFALIFLVALASVATALKVKNDNVVPIQRTEMAEMVETGAFDKDGKPIMRRMYEEEMEDDPLDLSDVLKDKVDPYDDGTADRKPGWEDLIPGDEFPRETGIIPLNPGDEIASELKEKVKEEEDLENDMATSESGPWNPLTDLSESQVVNKAKEQVADATETVRLGAKQVLDVVKNPRQVGVAFKQGAETVQDGLTYAANQHLDTVKKGVEGVAFDMLPKALSNAKEAYTPGVQQAAHDMTQNALKSVTQMAGDAVNFAADFR